MKDALGIFDVVMSSDGNRVPERMQTRTMSENVRVCPSEVSEYVSSSRSSSELMSEFLPVLTK